MCGKGNRALRCVAALVFAAFAAVWAGHARAADSAPGDDRAARLRVIQDLAPVAGMASAGLLALEKNQDGSYPNTFDLRFDLGGGATVRLYRQHALRKTPYQGASVARDLGGGQSVLWEMATLETTPLLQGALGLKRSMRTPRKNTTLAVMHLPRIGAGLPVERESRYLVIWSRETAGRDHGFGTGALRGGWNWRRKAALAFLGESPVVDGLSQLRQDLDARLELHLTSRVRPFVAYHHTLDIAQLGGLVPDARYLDSSDWWETLSMNRSAEAGLTVSLPSGATLRYGLETDRHFGVARETVSLNRTLGGGLELAAAWTHDRGVDVFTTPWQEERTRVQIMKRRPQGLSWGAFFEFRPGETISGLALMRGAGPDDPLPFTPETRFREPFSNPDARWDFNSGSIVCGSFASYPDVVSTLVTPELVSQFSKCLNYGDYNSTGPLHSPEEIFAGAEATCRSTSWLQSSILTQNGYESYVVAFQGSQAVMGAESDRRFAINHAVTAYRDPATGAWNLIDYERIIRTGAPTLQEAMEIYSPNYVFLRVEESEKLLPLGTFDSPTMETIRNWVEAPH